MPLHTSTPCTPHATFVGKVIYIILDKQMEYSQLLPYDLPSVCQL